MKPNHRLAQTSGNLAALARLKRHYIHPRSILQGNKTFSPHIRDRGYRMLIVENYLVFYVLKEKIIQIRRILHSARNYEFLL
ncbi:MAG: type II toxin-antitoxin system RelE/ParE family toxin [bacterium]|nr:type II toxin-antitoxin system RelE/ParE family toxin [bacterium]